MTPVPREGDRRHLHSPSVTRVNLLSRLASSYWKAKPSVGLHDRSGQTLRPDQATAKAGSGRAIGESSPTALRGPARRSRAQGTAASSKRGIVHVHQEQGARRRGDADHGRRRRRGGRAHRGNRHRRPRRRAARPASTSSAKQFGTHHSPNFIVDVLRQGEQAGQPIILFRTANYDPALDWTVAFQGTVADFYAAGLVSSAVTLHYGGLAAGLPERLRRSRTSTRRSAWTPACASAWPPPRSRARA